MSKNLNLCQFIGHIGQQPEIKYSAGGSAIANISLACGDDYKDKQGQKVEQTNWIRAVAFGKTAELIESYVNKGDKLYISGKQVTRKWQAQDGSDRYTTEININQIEFLGGKSDSAQAKPAQQRPAQEEQAQEEPAQEEPAPQGGFDSFDNDIPFNSVDWRVI